MQETPGLSVFPDVKGIPEREASSDPHLQFGGLGQLKLTVYRVGFQVQRELRNQFESWLRVGITYNEDFREVLIPNDSSIRLRLRRQRANRWRSSPIVWSMAATSKTFMRTFRCQNTGRRYDDQLRIGDALRPSLFSQELEEIFGLLYKKDGRLQDKWMVGPLAGTKLFGPELNAAGTKVAVLACVDKDPSGDFLMVHEQHRRLGIGHWVLQTLLRLLYEEVSPTSDHSAAWQSFLNLRLL